jgi:hypothetical protein
MLPSDERAKFILTLCVMALTGWWGAFTVNCVKEALNTPDPGTLLQAAGASGLLGTLSTLLTLSWQYWFRKAKPVPRTKTKTTSTQTPQDGQEKA